MDERKYLRQPIEFFDDPNRYTSDNYGDYYITKQYPLISRVQVYFPDTGYSYRAGRYEAKIGCVKDVYRPSIYGVGCIGLAHKKGNKKFYNIWLNIISRCYNQNDNAYKFYGAKGCTVDVRWHCFENFLEDIQYLPGYDEMMLDPFGYELDKDTLQPNVKCKVYSKDTCMWIKKSDNAYQSVLDNKHKRTSKYVGVLYDGRHGDKWQVQVYVNGVSHYLGKYTSEIAAANAYNYYIKENNLNVRLNDCPYMSKEEVISYHAGKIVYI